MTADLDDREALAERLVDGLTNAMETFGVYLGVELGLYRDLAELGPATSTDIAERTGVAERYAREWLEQQAVAGYLRCQNPSDPSEFRRFHLPEGHADVLVNADSPYYVAPLAVALAGLAKVVPRLVDSYRTGEGVPYADYGREIREGIAGGNRPMFMHDLADVWLPAMPDVHERLASLPTARVLDVACGAGASSLALALAYPRATVLGVDLDEASVADARVRGRGCGCRRPRLVRDRRRRPSLDLRRHVRPDHGVRSPARHGDPGVALRAVRRLVADGGAVLVADERVADTFIVPGDRTERLMYGWSILHCLPATLAEEPVVATGTILRAPILAGWAAARASVSSRFSESTIRSGVSTGSAPELSGISPIRPVGRTLCDAVHHGVDDPFEEVSIYWFAGEQQPQMDRADHRFDDPPRIGACGGLAPLDRPLDDDGVEREALSPEVAGGVCQDAVVRRPGDHRSSHRRHLRAGGVGSGGVSELEQIRSQGPVVGNRDARARAFEHGLEHQGLLGAPPAVEGRLRDTRAPRDPLQRHTGVPALDQLGDRRLDHRGMHQPAGTTRASFGGPGPWCVRPTTGW